jgi:hypothetical protein
MANTLNLTILREGPDYDHYLVLWKSHDGRDSGSFGLPYRSGTMIAVGDPTRGNITYLKK